MAHDEREQSRFEPSSADFRQSGSSERPAFRRAPPSQTGRTLAQPGARDPVTWRSEAEEHYDAKPTMYSKQEAPGTQTTLAMRHPGEQRWESDSSARFARPPAGPAPERVKVDSNRAQWDMSHPSGDSTNTYSTTSRETFSARAPGDTERVARGGGGRESTGTPSPPRSSRHAVPEARRGQGYNIISNQ